MKQEYKHILALVALATLSKLAIFKDVTINGDTGLYLTDAQQLNYGKQIFVDFPSRSPVMEYLLAIVIRFGDSPIIAARSFMLLVSLAVGVAIYAVARELHSHRAGLVAAALWYFTPYTMVWSLWVKTEPVAALLVLVAVWLALRVCDDEDVSIAVMAAIGVLFGTAFLVRRVVIVHIGVFGLFWLWYRYRNGQDLRTSVTSLSTAAATTVGSLALAYLLLARFDLGLAAEMTRAHAIALVESSGQGSLGWIGLENYDSAMTESRSSLFAQVCQKCGPRTVEVWKQCAMVSLPLGLSLLAGLRSFIRVESRFFGDWILPAAIGAAGVFGVGNGLVLGAYDRVFGALCMIGAVLLVWYADSPDWEQSFDARYVLPLAILPGLSAGYLYRDRIQYMSYFQDFAPWLAIVAALCIVAVLNVNRDRQTIIAAGLAILAISGLVGMGFAYPFKGSTDDNDWMTIDHVQEYGDFMDEHLDTDERLVTAQPLYAIESDRRIVVDLSRRYYAYRQFPNSNKADATTATLVSAIHSGRAPLAINDTNMLEILNQSDAVEQAFDNCYEPVSNELINATGGQLYEWRGCE